MIIWSRVRRRIRRSSGEGNQLQTLDALRIVAASAIVVYHFRHYLSVETADMLAPVAHFHYAVDLFFVLSGFVIAHVYSGRISTLTHYRSFLRRRVARLAPLHWLTLGFYAVVGLALAGGLAATEHAENYDWSCFAPNALGIHAFGVCDGLTFNFVSWSISAEMGMYLIAPLLLMLGARSPRAVLALAVVAAAALSVVAVNPDVAPFLPDRPWTEWTYDFGVLRALPAFLFGVSLHFLRDRLTTIPRPGALLTAAAAVFVAGAMWMPHPALLVALAYAIAALGVATDVQGRSNAVAVFLAPAGKLTYGVYMLHPVVLTLVLTLVGQRILGLTGTAKDALVVVAVVLTLVVSVVSLRVVEDPARRWMSGRTPRSRT